MRPQALIRSGNFNSPGNTTALPRFEFQKRSQLFIGANEERLPSSRCASAGRTVRPLESTGETQPQLQPALLRLSAISSQYFTYLSADTARHALFCAMVAVVTVLARGTGITSCASAAHVNLRPMSVAFDCSRLRYAR
jgi:hypothetical protein